MSFQRIDVPQSLIPKISIQNSNPNIPEVNSHKKPKVASYCRVSTDEEIQLGSLENQIIHYTNLIRSNPEWIYAGVYSDKGKSGTALEKRTSFNRMIRNALNGEIDIIICKSISRFARNIVDALEIIRQLTENGVNVIFERERLDTKNLTSSLLIKILATFAEEESRNISDNINWSINKRFERGEVKAGRIFGYHVNKDKQWEIVENEAAIIREAFDLFLDGYSPTYIAKQFISKGYKKRSGKSDWSNSTIRYMLTNERYFGDALNRKTCTLDFRSHKSVENTGHRPKYYVENHHQGIVSREDFQKVQKILEMHKKKSHRAKSNFTPFSRRVLCSKCGSNCHRYGLKEYRWRCSLSIKSKVLCQAKSIENYVFEELLIKGFEIRYGMENRTNDGLLIKQLIKEISSAEADRERDQNLLIVELEKCLIAENSAILSNHDVGELRNARIAAEENIASKTRLWESFDKDHSFREASLKKLKTLKGSDKAVSQLLDISFIRAWVIHIIVESPFSITVKWIDGKETKVRK